ncbi:MAG: hypothetical protein IJD92_00115 [Bacilli bacterium]|nr:hypothetical protein [Bacilli bacterium]
MKKIECMEEYIDSSLFLLYNLFGDDQNYTNDFKSNKRDILSSTVSLISIIMLAIKEDMVELQKDMSFKSKMFVNSLENMVSIISVKKDDGYYLDNYKFDSSADLVANLRNKLAHGNFYIDYNKEEIVLLHDGDEIKLDISKLRSFVIVAFKNILQDVKTNNYKRDFCLFQKVYQNRTKPITTNSELKDIIRNIRYYSFDLTCDNGLIPQHCIIEFNKFVKFYSDNMGKIKDTELLKMYDKVKTFFQIYNCKITMSSKKFVTDKIEEELILYSKGFLVDNPLLNYEEQIKLLLRESLKHANNEYKNFESILNNVNLLIILDAMCKVKSTVDENISHYLMKNGFSNIVINYDTYGTILINLLNTLFVYGYDDVYTKSGGYRLNRNGEFDFSLLKLGNINPSICEIDYTALEEAEANYRKTISRINKLDKVILEKQNQLKLVKKEEGKNKINDLLNDLKKEKTRIDQTKDIVEKYYLSVKNDFDNNYDYFKNKAIINGIRNSIAHGNYNVVSGNSIFNSKIIFDDIYNGKTTFNIELTFNDVLSIVLDNVDIIRVFIKDKTKELKKDTKKGLK